MAVPAEDAYCTLVLSDSYLPGAAVLSHSLRDAGTKKKLAALVTLDTLSADTVTELKKLYDVLLPVERIGNPKPANLLLMDRADLAYTFTKLALWRQTQYRKLVYIDADVVALRAPDELFDLDASFAAAPDVGWPDAFNTGVMVIKPDMGEYWALRTLASSGDTFDGADQGLLNQYYEHRGWHRLSFTYNCTPNAQYQWEPAYRHFKSRINMVHFIGRTKPWMMSTQSGAPGVYNELLAKWWSVYDRHLKASAAERDALQFLQAPNTLQRQIGGEAAGRDSGMSGTEQTPVSETVESLPIADEPLSDRGESAEKNENGLTQPVPAPEKRPFSPPRAEWDATRSAPPAESKPEAANFPTQTYGFSDDRRLFQAPSTYPEPPKDMWYKVPETKPKVWEPPKPIFPWEQDKVRPTASRVFAEDLPAPGPTPEAVPLLPEAEEEESAGSLQPSSEEMASIQDPWQAFGQTAGNAWDTVPGIDRYVRAVIDAQTKRTRPSGLSISSLSQLGDLSSPTGPSPARGRRESLKLTDFPSAFERPSLPVTPAPLRRPTFWGDERDETGQLPAAEGVPDQADWVCPRCGFPSESDVLQRQDKHFNPALSALAQSAQSQTFIASLPAYLKPVPTGQGAAKGSEKGADLTLRVKANVKGVYTANASSSLQKNPEERLDQLRRSSLLEIEHLKSASTSITPLRDLPEHSVSTEPAQHEGQPHPDSSASASAHGASSLEEPSSTTPNTASGGITTAPGGTIFREPAFSPQVAADAPSGPQREEIRSPTER